MDEWAGRLLSGRKRLRQISSDDDEGEFENKTRIDNIRSGFKSQNISQNTESDIDDDLLDFDFMGGRGMQHSVAAISSAAVIVSSTPPAISKASEIENICPRQPWSCSACTHNDQGDFCKMCGTRASRRRACKIKNKRKR